MTTDEDCGLRQVERVGKVGDGPFGEYPWCKVCAVTVPNSQIPNKSEECWDF